MLVPAVQQSELVIHWNITRPYKRKGSFPFTTSFLLFPLLWSLSLSPRLSPAPFSSSLHTQETQLSVLRLLGDL